MSNAVLSSLRSPDDRHKEHGGRKRGRPSVLFLFLLCAVMLPALSSCSKAQEEGSAGAEAHSVQKPQEPPQSSPQPEDAEEGAAQPEDAEEGAAQAEDTGARSESVQPVLIPAYSGEPYCVLHENKPFFSVSDLTTEPFETYSDLDALGRAGCAYANICTELMPQEARGSIGDIRPTGWVQNRYDGLIDTEPPYLYNRCHLIAYQLAGENANEKNLMTGTRQMNLTMLEFESRVMRYVTSTGHHVLYRVTPHFEGKELLAKGVRIEAQSVEDDLLSFHVYCYNVQPGIAIDYADGTNHAMTRMGAADSADTDSAGQGSAETDSTDADSAGTGSAGTDSKDEDSAVPGSAGTDGTDADSTGGGNLQTGQTEDVVVRGGYPDTFHQYNMPEQQETEDRYVINIRNKKVHHPGCSSVINMAPKNYTTSNMTIGELEALGYHRCNSPEEAQWPWE